MNRDAAVNMARELNAYATSDRKRNFVMLSSEKAPPFLSEYLTTKLEAERYVIEECKNLNPVMLRPGFVVDKDHRSWSPPLGKLVDLAWFVGEKAVKPIPVLGPATDFLFPAKSVQLATVCHFAIEGALGLLDEKIIRN
jgi:hypothetical protein